MNTKDMIKAFQKAANAKGESLVEDGVNGTKTDSVTDKYLFTVTATAKSTTTTPTTPNQPPQVKGAGLLWVPFAKKHSKLMRAKGVFKYGYPVLIVVHFTAGHFEKGADNAFSTIDGGIKDGYNYMCIAREGTIVQASPLNVWGYHAGESSWSKYLPKWISGSVSDESVGIEMNNAGKLEKLSDGRYQTWFKTYIPASDVRYVTEAEWGCPTGYYHKYSAEQEAALVKLIIWLIKNDPNGILTADHVVGHHEVAGKLGIGRWRKNDPGGALSMPMPKFREFLRKKLAE